MFATDILMPSQGSETADLVDRLFLFELAIITLVGVGVIMTILVFVARYRRRSINDRTPRILGSLRLELFWSITPFFIFMIMFVLGSYVYNRVAHVPLGTDEVYVVGKQWMWKIQHPDGQREINSLHLPMGRAVRLNLISEDVIHDFFVPAFRIHIDVLPGRYVSTWYDPNQVGDYHLLCSQYCGTNHSNMVGTIHVMERSAYERWQAEQADESLALKGRKLFLKLQCITCHSTNAGEQPRAPVLENLYGSKVFLDNGRTVIADDAYLRESILYPRAKVVQGWKPIMPTFKDQLADPSAELTEEEALIQLVAFIRSLRPGQTPLRNESFSAPVGADTGAPGPPATGRAPRLLQGLKPTEGR